MIGGSIEKLYFSMIFFQIFYLFLRGMRANLEF